MHDKNKFLPFGSEPWGRQSKKFKRYPITSWIDPLDFYVHELDKVLMRKSGWIDAGACPFHVGDTSGSFHVDLNTGAFACLSCEAKGRDIVDFTMLLHGLSLAEALEKLAYQWCYQIPLNGPGPWGGEGCHHATH